MKKAITWILLAVLAVSGAYFVLRGPVDYWGSGFRCWSARPIGPCDVTWRSDAEIPRLDDAVQEQLQDFGLDLFASWSETIPEGENAAISPLGIAMILGGLAEITGEEAQAEILEILRLDSVETMREQLDYACFYNSRGGGSSIYGGNSMLISTLWAEQGVPLRRKMMKRLGNSYYTGVWRSDLEEADFPRAAETLYANLFEVQRKMPERWLCFSAPKGPLSLSQICDVSLVWEGNNGGKRKILRERLPFYSADGTVKESGGFHLPFAVRQKKSGYTIYRNELNAGYLRAGTEPFILWIVVPDGGISLQETLADRKIMKLTFPAQGFSGEAAELSVPDSLIQSRIDVMALARSLGVETAFSEAADFSALSSKKGLSIAQAEQSITLRMNNLGINDRTPATAPSAGYCDLQGDIINRPFLYVLSIEGGLPLLAGVVNTPDG